MAKVKSSLIGVYLGVTPQATEYNRVGYFVESLSVNMNPTETDYADVTMDTQATDLESYKPTIEASGKLDKDDPVYKLFVQLYRKQKVLDEAQFPVVIVHLYDDGPDTADLYESATVVVNSIGLNGAAPAEIDFKISMNSSPVAGTATMGENNKVITAFSKSSSGGDG